MYIYSTIIGTFVFNQSFKIREKVLFSENEILENFVKLKKGEELDSERQFIAKFKNIINLRQSKDISLLQKALSEFSEFRQEYYWANILLTRHQIKESVKDDLLIIQSSNSISEITKAINLLTKRLREWYSLTLPELNEKISDNEDFAEASLKPRQELVKEFHIKNSMGKELSREDFSSIQELAKSVIRLFEEKNKKEKYLESLMKKTCPNLTVVAGFQIGAKLISLSGSFAKMARMPASTIQLLGAEKALFRHMVTGAKPPRHGIIVNHPLISGKPQKEHGKRARALADKISLAVKIDYFKGDFIGDKLKKSLEERFK